MSSASALDAVRVVLYEPQDPINIGATVRAMKNMGVSSLRLVRPTAYDRNKIEQVAHDTREIAERIEHYDSLPDAVADCVRVAGFTARRRAAKWRLVEPREAADDLLAAAEQGPVAVVFGREDAGLPNDALDLAHLRVTIPTTAHASLNLAQAVLVALYELHTGAGDATRRLARPRKHAGPPTSQQLELAFADAERALAALDFFRTRNAEYVMRSVRSLVFRAEPDGRELDLVRAMALEVLRTVDRVRRNALAEGRAAGQGGTLEVGGAGGGAPDGDGRGGE
jgi:tRNA/rRNA methyltransferase/tRNA (cytidine32/uridine32-2'-O)-methyltransferase